ncbi:AbfB domain-containing protein [Streptomyces sp. NPDC001920]
MAIATVIACATAIAVSEREPESSLSASASSESTSGPGLISFATPSKSTAPPEGKSGLSTAKETPKAPRPSGDGTPEPTPKPSKSPSGEAGSSPEPPAATWRSVRSVNFPDRYWRASGGYVRLEPVRGSESREDSTFKLVKGLAGDGCYSFATADGSYLRHREFVLRSERNDGSALFEQDATFCPRGSAHSGAVMLESANYPGRFLRHQNFQLRLAPFQNSSLYQADSSFQLVAGLA